VNGMATEGKLKEEEAVVELNILGQVCPACLLVVLKEINNHRDKLRSGRTRLVVRTDHRNATRTVPDSARKMGYEVDIKKVDTFYEITVGRKL
jgi:TusA-related sulfurtransferase